MCIRDSPWNHSPRWSPDAKRLAYCAGTFADFAPCIVVCHIETGEETAWAGGRTGLLRPVWVPSLRLLSSLREFDEAKSGSSGMAPLPRNLGEGMLLCIARIEGKGGQTTDPFVATQDELIPIVARHWQPENYVEWAPEFNADGSMLAIETNDGGDREVFAFTKSGAADVSNHRAADWNPVWSPGGRWIAFESFRSGRRGIYRVHAETARVLPIVESSDGDSWAPTWSPDGKWIGFVSDRTGDPELYIADVQGKQERRLTERPGPDYAPAWRPPVAFRGDRSAEFQP